MPTLQIPEKLTPLFEKKKRVKIAVGGRGGGKSIAFADAFMMFCAHGERLCCAREFQNSVDDSVHPLIKARIEHHQPGGFTPLEKEIHHTSGGEIFYRGLARNVESLKSTYGINRIWVEEAQTLSQRTLDVLSPTIRESESEIWFSLNRGSRNDPFSKQYLEPYEETLRRKGYYEDEFILIVQINYTDNPWFPPELEQERIRAFQGFSRQKYDHIWNGEYNDEVDNSIIPAEWFDACVDAHVKLGLEPRGIQVVSHDPSDDGEDDKGLCYRQGSIIHDCRGLDKGNIHDGGDWATQYAIDRRADLFVWDGDGMGVGLRRQVQDAFRGKKIEWGMFKGSECPDKPKAPYEGSALDSLYSKGKSNEDTFKNKRAQYYWELRERCRRTWEAVEKGRYHDPDTLVSFSSDIGQINQLRAELCRIPRKDNTNLIQILSKAEMKRQGIPSPNMADAVMMSFYLPHDYWADDEDNDEYDERAGRSAIGGY